MNRTLRTLRLPLALILGSAAGLASAAAADSATRLDLAASAYTETADGALLLNAEPVRLVHRPELVASNCVKVETGFGGYSSARTSLANTCGTAITVSYCIASDEPGAQRCDDIGRREFQSATLAAGGRLALAASTPVGTDVRWVACEAGDDRYSTLTDNGSRGECLVADGPTAVAERAR